MDLHNIREDYSKRELSESHCAADPMVQFEQWLNEAISVQVKEPTAMNLATIDERGRPAARIVLLKEVNRQGFVFFTNYLSQKGRALAQHPFAALTFFWPELERQVRVEGKTAKLAAEQSDQYFASRPYASRVGAWASEQSKIISAKSVVLGKAALIAAKYPLHIPRPPHWGGFILIPDSIEFWQGRPSRLHDRIRYRLENQNWIKERLSP
ncbi:pyridoxamine 5'-phosphate oxidase [Mesocricetibacter intestinalis]|uniref:Pyridoxine/pyridoxamine 5'-phosphate oxidase n=1 Tax=Mesocricetibacter intestinalis TaxID=1521930 RepID=A0A4R6V9R7_9PAST|nr:pyridoxamine 5'-phosphate oxidase [Mesocricetibacter intestinalis]TDQ56145.1 pyridoxamine 5'-phosphate oxidase [Mesocricetibacter intestinalis]